MGILRNLFGDIDSVVRAIAAVPAGLLPRRRWSAFRGIPIERLALVSALTTLAVGWAVGIRGFFEFAQAAADGLAAATLGSAAKLAAHPNGPETVSLLPAMTASAFSPLAFLVATPTGWLADYLVLSGAARALGAWFDDPLGDPVLTGLDCLVTAIVGGTRVSHRRKARERQEGPEVPDRLYRAAWAGISDADFVLVSSRRKPDWTKGTFVITSDKWYTLGEPFDLLLPQGLRTAYPLTEQKVCEVLRRGVAYDLPPLAPPTWRERSRR